MNDGPSADVADGFAQYLMGKRSHVALAKEQESKDVGHRVAFLPLEINMRNMAGHVLDVDKESSNRIGHDWAPRRKDAMIADSSSFDAKTLSEF